MHICLFYFRWFDYDWIRTGDVLKIVVYRTLPAHHCRVPLQHYKLDFTSCYNFVFIAPATIWILALSRPISIDLYSSGRVASSNVPIHTSEISIPTLLRLWSGFHNLSNIQRRSNHVISLCINVRSKLTWRVEILSSNAFYRLIQMSVHLICVGLMACINFLSSVSEPSIHFEISSCSKYARTINIKHSPSTFRNYLLPSNVQLTRIFETSKPMACILH